MATTVHADAGGAIDAEAMLQRAMEAVQQIMDSVADPAHNMVHVLAVVDHVRQALADSKDLTSHQKAVLMLAALLHEVDDDKLVSTTANANARRITKAATDGCAEAESLTGDVISVIELVSAKKNKNSTVAPSETWKLIVRDADRLEAVGEVGIARSYAFNKRAGMPLFLPSTARARTTEEVWQIATPERFAAYSGSTSMIDHYYDKLLHVCHCSSGNAYLQRLFAERQGTMIDFVLKFGQHGDVDEAALEKLEAKYCTPSDAHGPAKRPRLEQATGT